MEKPLAAQAPKKGLYTSGSLGCTNAMVLYQRYADFILSHGYEKTSDIATADVILVDTCASTEMQEQASFDLVAREQRRARKDAKVIVCGCLPAMDPKKFQERWKGDYFTPANQFMLARILGIDREEERFLTPYENPGRFMGADDAAGAALHPHVPFVRLIARGLLEVHRANNALGGEVLETLPFTRTLFRISQQCNARNYTINISQGCVGECTFCTIPLAKGRTRSLPVGLIIEKLREKIEEGVRQFTLSSDDSGAYGVDIGTDLIQLLRKIHEIPGDYSLYINCFDPRWLQKLGEGMMEQISKGRIKYLQVALQSGSDRILARMKRGYRMGQVMPVLRRMRVEFPGLTLGSQFIAGFPGETAEDLLATQRVIEEDLFDHLFVFDFSQRPGAESELLDAHLTGEAVRRHGRQLRRAWTRTRLRRALGLSRRGVAPADQLAARA